MIVVNDVIFREYDIRGKVGSELHIEQVGDLTRAILYYFKTKNNAIKTIAVGMDGRIHSAVIKDAVCKALLESGIDVVFIGLCPSPALYFALYTQPVDGGLMITASHNPKDYNGIKICLGTQMVWGQQIAEIKKLFRDQKYADKTTIPGTLTTYDINAVYIAWLVEHFAHLKNLTLPLVIDCGNGSAGAVIPTLVEQLGWSNAQILYAAVDGTYPNHEADPTVEKNMLDVRKALATTDAVCGLGLDGDADRMAVMTKEGVLVPGDRLLAVFAQFILKSHAAFTVVADVKSSENLVKLLKQWGIATRLTPSGHAIIKDEMKKSKALLAGELSCHFFFADRYFGYDDGIYALLRVVEMLVATHQSITQLLKIFPVTYGTREFRIAYDDTHKAAIINAVKNAFENRADTQLLCVDGVRVVTPYGWGIVRPSNTQTIFCLRFESDTPEGLARLKAEFIEILAPYFDQKLLTTEFSS